MNYSEATIPELRMLILTKGLDLPDVKSRKNLISLLQANDAKIMANIRKELQVDKQERKEEELIKAQEEKAEEGTSLIYSERPEALRKAMKEKGISPMQEARRRIEVTRKENFLKEERARLGIDKVGFIHPDMRIDRLSLLAAFGLSQDLEKALNLGIDPNQQSHAVTTPLISAISTGREENLRLLLNAGANPNLADRCGVLPLAFANFLFPKSIMVEMLIKAGANPENISPKENFDFLKIPGGFK